MTDIREARYKRAIEIIMESDLKGSDKAVVVGSLSENYGYAEGLGVALDWWKEQWEKINDR